MANPIKGPVVFAYKATSYERVPPDRLADWERRMRDLVGIEGKITLAAGFTETDSSCGAQGIDD